MTQQDPDTSSFPAQPGYHPPSRQPRRGGSGVAIGVLALLVVVAVGLGLWMYNAFLGGDSEENPAAAASESSSAPETVTTTVPPATSTEPETVTTTVDPPTTESPEPEPEPEPEPAPEPEVVTVTPTISPGTYRAPDSAVQCAANVNWRIYRANDQTSCGFAESVAVQMSPYAGLPGSAQIEARSPVTGQDYVMNCLTQGDNSYVCQGGNNAVVILESRSVRD